MGALDTLYRNNGLKTTNTVLGKQQSGQDAAQKANPEAAHQEAVRTNLNTAKAMLRGKEGQLTAPTTGEEMNRQTAHAMLHGKGDTLSPPKDDHDAAVRTNRQTYEDIANGNAPIVKQEQENEEEKPKQKTYAEMFKELYGNGEETEEQRKKREKRERTRAIIAAVGDGIRALSDMYYSSRGATIYRDPNNDLTANMLKRKQMLEDERKKNHDAWVTGYQKAMALDEQKRKNQETLAETIRHNKELEGVAKTKTEQTDEKLAQSKRRLDLTEWKYTNDADYKNSLLKIKEMLAKGQISHWDAQDAMAQMRETRLASKANTASGGKSTTAGYWYEYFDLMDTDEGKKQIETAKRKYGIRSVTQTNVRYLMDKIKGRRSQGAPSNTGGGNGKTTQKGGKGSSSSKGGKKSTGVKW